MNCAVLTLLSVLILIGSTNSAKTSPHFKEIFMGRCHGFKLESLYEKGTTKNCDDLWNKFVSAVYGKNEATEQDYKEYFDTALKGAFPLKNKALFWSRTSTYANLLNVFFKHYVTVNSMLPGYLVDGLNWCGSDEISNDFSKNDCPPWETKEGHMLYTFWAYASKEFADAAVGKITILVNGSSNAPAYDKISILRAIEIPAIDGEKVTSAEIIVWLNHKSYQKKMKKYYYCESENIMALRNSMVEKLGEGNVTCEENPDFIHHLNCAFNSELHGCGSYTIHLNVLALFVILAKALF